MRAGDYIGTGAALLMALAGGLPGLDAGPTPFKETEAERKIWGMHPEKLISEYNLIQEKKSNFSRREREMVEARIQYLIKKGYLRVVKESV